jgi:hypothetical protein
MHQYKQHSGQALATNVVFVVVTLGRKHFEEAKGMLPHYTHLCSGALQPL